MIYKPNIHCIDFYSVNPEMLMEDEIPYISLDFVLQVRLVLLEIVPQRKQL
jgi:hypothetical protein